MDFLFFLQEENTVLHQHLHERNETLHSFAPSINATVFFFASAKVQAKVAQNLNR